MPLIYRSMLSKDGKPVIGCDDHNLGVRVPPHPRADIQPDADGHVSPGGYGLSVAPSLEALGKLPFLVSRRLRARFPRARGVDELVCWKMGEGPFIAGPVATGLQLCPDPRRPTEHALVEPDQRMPLAEYQQALAATQELWEPGED
jgi:hypothetical protein